MCSSVRFFLELQPKLPKRKNVPESLKCRFLTHCTKRGSGFPASVSPGKLRARRGVVKGGRGARTHLSAMASYFHGVVDFVRVASTLCIDRSLPAGSL